MADGKTVDFRAVNLGWLVDFKDKVLSRELAAEVELVVATRALKNIGANKGDTLKALDPLGSGKKKILCSKPYGDVTQADVPVNHVAIKERKDWSTEDVCEYVIKPECMALECTFLDIMEAGNVAKRDFAGTFVSQARKCNFNSMVSALEYFYEIKSKNIKQQFVWLDIFCANQPKLTAKDVKPEVRKENEDLLTKGLHQAIANFEEIVMFIDKWDDPYALKRAWCVWEVFGVSKAKKHIEVALPRSEHERYVSRLIKDPENILATVAKVDTKTAQCFNPIDLAMIKKEIKKQTSFGELNELIRSQLRLWVASSGATEVSREEAKGKSADLKLISTLATVVGVTYEDQGQYEMSLKFYQKGLDATRRISKDAATDVDVGVALNNVAGIVQKLEKYNEALSLYKESLEIYKRVYKEKDSKDVATALSNMGSLYARMEKYDEAFESYQKALDMDKRIFGKESSEVATDLTNLATLYSKLEKDKEALPLYREALAITEKTSPALHENVAMAKYSLATVIFKVDMDDPEALKLAREAASITQRTLGPTHHYTQWCTGLVEDLESLLD